MGGKATPSNNQMVSFEMQQAQDAKDKENLRQARLDQGKSAIDQLYSSDNFGDAFYNKYKNAELAYTQPQLTEQFGKAKTGLTYDLARAGLLDSSVQGYALGLLNKQNDVNQAGLVAKADTDTGALRTSIASQKDQAMNQLFATEDPAVAASTAANSATGAQLQQPNLQPLGDLFKPIVVGAGAALQPAYGAYQANQYLGGGTGTTNPTGSGSIQYSSQT